MGSYFSKKEDNTKSLKFKTIKIIDPNKCIKKTCPKNKYKFDNEQKDYCKNHYQEYLQEEKEEMLRLQQEELQKSQQKEIIEKNAIAD